jgi:hypothetical protein
LGWWQFLTTSMENPPDANKMNGWICSLTGYSTYFSLEVEIKPIHVHWHHSTVSASLYIRFSRFLEVSEVLIDDVSVPRVCQMSLCLVTQLVLWQTAVNRAKQRRKQNTGSHNIHVSTLWTYIDYCIYWHNESLSHELLTHWTWAMQQDMLIFRATMIFFCEFSYDDLNS